MINRIRGGVSSSITLLKRLFQDLTFFNFLYILLLLSLVFLIFRAEIIWLWKDWFSDGNLVTKGPIVWLIAVLMLVISINSNQILESKITIIDIIFTLVILLSILVFKDDFRLLLVILLYASIFYFSTHPNYYSSILIGTCFLYFSLPYYNFIAPHLQWLVVIVMERMLGIFSIPVLVQEFYITIPTGQILVEQSCNGARFLANNLILLFLYSILSRFSSKQFFFAIIVTVLLSLLVNWIRIFIIILVAHNWGFDVPFFVRDHGNLGWVIYVIMLVPFFYFLNKIERIKKTTSILVEKGSKKILNIPSSFLLLPIFIYASY